MKIKIELTLDQLARLVRDMPYGPEDYKEEISKQLDNVIDAMEQEQVRNGY